MSYEEKVIGMRILIANLLRILAYKVSEADVRNFKSIFQGYIAPKYLRKVDWNMVGAVANRVVQALFLKTEHQEVIDHFVDFLLGVGEKDPVEKWNQHASNIKAGLVTQLIRQFPEFKELGPDKTAEAVKYGKVPKLENLRKYQTLAGKLVGGQLLQYLNHAANQFIREKSKRERIDIEREKNQDIPFEEKEDYETYTPPEKGPAGVTEFGDDAMQTLKKMRRDKSLIRKIRHFIDSITDEKKKKIYRALLNDRLLTEKPKSLTQIAEDVGSSQSAVERFEKILISDVREHFLGTKEIKEEIEEEVKGDVKVPPYTETLKNKSDSDSFKDFYRIGIRSMGRPPSEITSKIMEALAEGKSSKEIVSELKVSDKDVRNTRSRHFNKQYEKWYRARHPKQASIADFIRMIVQGVQVCTK